MLLSDGGQYGCAETPGEPGEEPDNSSPAALKPRNTGLIGMTLVSVLLQLLGEHDQDSAGSAEIREFVDVTVGRHAT